jgi:hypothetical protein
MMLFLIIFRVGHPFVHFIVLLLSPLLVLLSMMVLLVMIQPVISLFEIICVVDRLFCRCPGSRPRVTFVDVNASFNFAKRILCNATVLACKKKKKITLERLNNFSKNIYIFFLPISDFSNEWTVRAIREAKIESRTSDTPNLLPEMISSPMVDENPALKISYNRVYD